MKELSGQQIEITHGGNILLHIRSMFNSAGKIYRFPYNCPGVGINESIVNFAEDTDAHIILSIGEMTTKYFIHPKKVKEISRKYNSHDIQKGVPLFIVPIRELKPL